MTDQGPNFSNLSTLWHDIGSQVQILAASGVAGAVFKAIVAPKPPLMRRVVQGFAGALSAVFLGGVAAALIDAITHTGPFAYLCAGFIFGSGGEMAVQALQDRLLGPHKSKDEDAA